MLVLFAASAAYATRWPITAKKQPLYRQLPTTRKVKARLRNSCATSAQYSARRGGGGVDEGGSDSETGAAPTGATNEVQSLSLIHI